MDYIVRVHDDLDIAAFRLRLRQVDRTEDLAALVGTIAETLIEQGKADDLSLLISRPFGALPPGRQEAHCYGVDQNA